MSQRKPASLSQLEALTLFSRDHYTEIVRARNLQKSAAADDETCRKAQAEFLDAWNRRLAEHFREEERLLSDLLRADDRQRLLREHRRLTELAQQLHAHSSQADPDRALLVELGGLLEQHIRWEERELYRRLHGQLGQEQLAAWRQQTVRNEKARVGDP